ncbi:MAG: biotin transporter BioY [Candidatus Velthaea sp.]
MALSAKIAVPIGPVPITGQTLAIPVLVALLGRNQAVYAILAYLAEGLAGLPVFAAGALFGPTAGYLLAFPVAAFIIGSLYERGFGRTYGLRFFAVFLGTSIVFVGGAAWLMVFLKISVAKAFAAGVLPFLIGDVAKCLIAAGVPPSWPRFAQTLGIRDAVSRAPEN